MPIKFHVRALADPKQSLDAKRKLLQKASVGDGVLSGLATLALPMMKTFFRAMRDRDWEVIFFYNQKWKKMWEKSIFVGLGVENPLNNQKYAKTSALPTF